MDAPRDGERAPADAGFAAVLADRTDALADELQESTRTDLSRLAAEELQTAAPREAALEPADAAEPTDAPRGSTSAPRSSSAISTAPASSAASGTASNAAPQPAESARITKSAVQSTDAAATQVQPVLPNSASALNVNTRTPPVPGAYARAAQGPNALRPANAVHAGLGKAGAAREALARLAGKAQEPRLVQGDTITGQVTRGLEAALRQGGGRVLLRLNPEHLGPVSVRLAVAGGSVRATLEPRTEAARRLLTDSVDTLRAALEARGLSVERIEIDGSRIDPGFVPPGSAGSASPDGDSGRRPTQDGGRGGEVPAGDPVPVAASMASAPVYVGAGGALRLDALA